MQGPAPAPINGPSGTALNPDVRNNDRTEFDDVDLAAQLFERTQQFLPQNLHGGELIGFNERFRGYRYTVGQRFAPHYDGTFARNELEESQLSALGYLNAECEGGQTRLLDYHIEMTPQIGSMLVFEHAMLHEGAEVTAGSKFALRSDAMYRFRRRIGALAR